jgi:hypothetical protein
MPVTDRHDEIEDWLGAEVHPLPPPPGTFERIQRGARRRKTHQVLVTAAGAVVVIAGAVLAPTIAPSLLAGNSHPTGPPLARGSFSPDQQSTPANSTSKTSPPSSSTPASSSSASAGGTRLSVTTSGTAAPPSFRPTSITMISTSIGAVIGQAGTAGHCAGPVAAYCTSLAGTSDDGQHWYGVSAPVTGAPDGASGVGQLRYLDLNDGWAYGPQLFVTSDGGADWTQENTYGLRVTDLETAGSMAFAVLASCQGGGAAYASDCSKFSLYSTAKGTTSLQRVQLQLPAGQRATAMGTSGQASSATLALTGGPSGGQGYLLSPSGDILTGSLTGSPWKYAGKAPCTPGTAAANGTPLGAQLAAGSTRLLINCASPAGSGSVRTGTGGSGQANELYQSTSGGASWTKVSQPPAAGQATSLAGSSQGDVVLATTSGIDYSPDGTSWQQATITGGAPRGGFQYVGMTSPTQGVAVPADASLGEVYITTDAGLTWTASQI